MDVKAEKVNPYNDDHRNKGEQVRDMFDNIAPAYDFMNRAMTLGIDTIWRKKAVRLIDKDAMSKSCNPYQILDVATGTADLAIMMAKKIKDSHITGVDLSKEMVLQGRIKVEKAKLENKIALGIGDCLALPFSDEAFDCVSVAFGVRNFEHLYEGYREMLRVLKPGGMLCVIELSTPPSPIIKPLYNAYTNRLIPWVGKIISKDTSAYSYLPASIAAVPQREEMTNLICSAGFKNARFYKLTFGVCTIYVAYK